MTTTALILFPNEWISYSPSILNLVKQLKARGNRVTVICFGSKKYPVYPEEIEAELDVITIPGLLLGIAAMMGCASALRTWLLQQRVKRHSYDVCVGVDLAGARALSGMGIPFHYYSLELERHAYYQSEEFSQHVRSVVFQSQERFHYMFDNQALTLHLIQNAPFYSRQSPFQKSCEGILSLVCMGNLIPRHGIYQCIEALEYLDADTMLTLIGRLPDDVERTITERYQSYLSDKRLVIHRDYIPQQDVLEFLSRFHIGYCFYDFDLIKKGDFNYLSSPSGKLYNYFAAGIPVIGSNIIGLQDAVTYKAGELLDDTEPRQMALAVKKIAADYDSYLQGCHQAAVENDFGSSCQPFIETLSGE